ncbi:MAG: HlyD family secretion protein [Alphaproteobacteria bacterium]|nr:HlyD family secretion protein [Alphaproteobacteria bacterium]
MKMTHIRLLAGGGILILLLLAGVWWLKARHYESTDDAYTQNDISLISSQVSGSVAKIAVADNQIVKVGDVLVRIDNRDFKSLVSQALAALAEQEAALENAKHKLELQQTLICQSQANLEKAKVMFHQTHKDAFRSKRLYAGRAISQQSAERSEVDFLNAKADLESLKAELKSKIMETKILKASHNEVQAKVKQAQVKLRLAKSDLEHTVIRSPIDGVVGNKSVQLGQYVRVGAPMLSIVPLNSTYVVANFKETQIGKMKTGQKVKLHIDAFPEHYFKGKIDSISPATGSKFSLLPPDNATGNFTKIVQRIPVKILIHTDKPLEPTLRSGLSVYVSVNLQSVLKEK